MLDPPYICKALLIPEKKNNASQVSATVVNRAHEVNILLTCFADCFAF